MAITCEWNYIIGSIDCLGYDGDQYKLTIYGGGNCFGCICYVAEEEHEDGTIEKYRHLHDFIVDKEHLKRILASDNCHYHDCYKHIWLNSQYKEVYPIAKMLAQAGLTVTLTMNVKEEIGNRPCRFC